jgi:hypothetical protein
VPGTTRILVMAPAYARPVRVSTFGNRRGPGHPLRLPHNPPPSRRRGSGCTAVARALLYGGA